jgi:3-methylcrotonyl-CoA carboxylase alpha subunit
MFDTILIANRGEIACRVIKTAQKMGIETVAVYSEADQDALHVRLADDTVFIGAAPATQSYLVIDNIIAAAKQTGAKAIHPGYGFLSENVAFSKRCADEGIVFIGPSESAIEAMGLKDRAKDIMREAGVPVVPGYQGDNQDPAFLKSEADKIGYPILIKAVAGGGGKGMRRIDDAKTFLEDLESCKREAKAAFSNDAVLIEKYIEKPRHIELQVFGDSHGNYVHLFERDCSVQRRHQKVVEEAPAPHVDADLRAQIGEIAVKAARAIDYCGAGTIEFIVDASAKLSEKAFYFMEMNTRLQVEHPVSEMISGQDFVEWQIRIAAGEKLPKAQDELCINGHALELRIYAEDPAHDFVPQTGEIYDIFTADLDDPHYRIDSGVDVGDRVSVYYDPMIAKLICWGESREIALNRMNGYLAQTAFLGVNNNQEFLRNIITHNAFQKADLHTHFVEQHHDTLLPKKYAKAECMEAAITALYLAAGFDRDDSAEISDPWAICDNWRMNHDLKKLIRLRHHDGVIEASVEGSHDCYQVSIDGEICDMRMIEFDGETGMFEINGSSHHFKISKNPDDESINLLSNGRVLRFQRERFDADSTSHGANEGQIISPMPGTIIKILVEKGAKVAKDQPLIIMEAMKLEMTLRAPRDGVIESLNHGENDQVIDGAVLLALREEEAA